jgi:hypothetical protein
VVFVKFKEREIPKSPSFPTKLASRRTLSGFRSPWAMLFGLLEWRKISAVHMSAAILMRILHGSGSVWCLHWRRSSRLPFAKNSETSTFGPLHTPMRVTKLGCLILHRISTCNICTSHRFRCIFLPCKTILYTSKWCKLPHH